MSEIEVAIKAATDFNVFDVFPNGNPEHGLHFFNVKNHKNRRKKTTHAQRKRRAVMKRKSSNQK